jgi:hypothetical protein
MKRMFGLLLVLVMGVLLVSACSSPRPSGDGGGADMPSGIPPAADTTPMPATTPEPGAPPAEGATAEAEGTAAPAMSPISIDNTPVPDIVSTVAPGEVEPPVIEESGPVATPEGTEMETAPTVAP